MSTAPLTKAQRREEARAAAARLRQQQERQAERQRAIVIGGLTLGLVVLAAVIWFVLSSQPAEQDADVETPSLSSVTAPAGATDAGGIPVGAEGVAGQAGAAGDDTVVVTVYSDYMCPFCGLFEQSNGPVLDELREAGDVVVEYHPVSILDRFAEGSAYSTRAATAAALVADRAPDAFLGLNAALFAEQPAEGTTGLSDARIAELARDAGAPDEVVATIEDGSYLEGPDSFAPWVAAATAQASEDLGGRLATPTILLDGEVLDTAAYDWRQPGRLAAAIEDARG